MRSHNPTPLMAHHSVFDYDSPPLVDMSFWGFPFRAFSQGFTTRLLGRGFHTLIRNASFPSPTDVGSQISNITKNQTSLGGLSSSRKKFYYSFQPKSLHIIAHTLACHKKTSLFAEGNLTTACLIQSFQHTKISMTKTSKREKWQHFRFS